MTAKVLFNCIGHFQTNYHLIDMNVIKFNINKKDFLVCSVPQNSTISQFKHVTLLPGLVTTVTMKISFYIRFITRQLLINDQPYLIRWLKIKLKAGKLYLA